MVGGILANNKKHSIPQDVENKLQLETRVGDRSLGICQYSATDVIVCWHQAAVLGVAVDCTCSGRKEWFPSVMVRLKCFGIMSVLVCLAVNLWEHIQNLFEEEGCVR